MVLVASHFAKRNPASPSLWCRAPVRFCTKPKSLVIWSASITNSRSQQCRFAARNNSTKAVLASARDACETSLRQIKAKQINKTERTMPDLTRRLISIASLATAAMLVATAAQAQKQYGPGVTDTEIKIGNIIPYSGP